MSTTISERLATEIKTEVSRLLGRGRTTFECPLSEEERAALWHGMLNPDLVRAFDMLVQYGHDVGAHKTYHLRFTTCLEGEGYTIEFWNPSWRLIMEYNDIYRGADRIANAFPQPVERWPDFVQWVQNTGRVEKEFSEAQDTLEALLGFCNTVGQLTRAVPELAQYLTREKREILQGQKRASNMPYEWATFDRARVNNLQFALAKAHLMPLKRNEAWGEINGSRAILEGKPA